MSKKILFFLVCGFLVAIAIEKTPLIVSPEQISIPQALNYQGKLTNVSGNSVPDSIYTLTFRFFPTLTGGTAIWGETQSVQTHSGLFNCLLGSVIPIANIPADGNCYLEMQVNPNPAMTPRIRIVSSAYSFLAKKADTANYATNAPLTRPITPPVATNEIDDGAVNSAKILDGSITRTDVTNNFKSPYSDTSDYTRNVNVQYVDSARVATNAYKLQGKDTIALSTKFVDEGQANAITTGMIVDSAITNAKIKTNAVTSDKIQDGTITRTDVTSNFKAPYSDTSDYARASNVQFVDSSRVSTNTYKLQGKDTLALSAKFVDEGQANAISTGMVIDSAVTTTKIKTNAVTTDKIQDGTITRTDVISNFKAPYSDTADYARVVPAIDSVRISVNAYNAYKLQGKDTIALSAKFIDEGQLNSVSSTMIQDGTIIRNDVASDFKSPYSDTADYARVVPAIDSVRISANAYNAYKLQGKDTSALDTRYVNENQTNAISTNMLQDSSVTSVKIKDNTITRQDVSISFKAPYSDTADYARVAPAIDSARVAANAHNAYKLQGKDTSALDTRYVNEGQINSVTSAMIQDETIDSVDIKNNAITNSKLAPNSVSTDKILNGSISTDDIEDGAITNYLLDRDAVTSSTILDSTITRADVKRNFKAPYADTADYARAVNAQYVDSSRISANTHRLQGKDTLALSAKFVDEGQTNAISNIMIIDNAVNSGKILDGTIIGADIATPCTLQNSISFPGAVLHIKNTGTGRGILIDSAGFGGLSVNYAFTDGVNIGRALQYGVYVDTAGGDGMFISNTGIDGIGINNAGWDGMYITYAGINGVEVTDVATDGIYIMHAGDNGIRIDSAESYGVFAHGNIAAGNFIASNASANGLIVHAYNNTATDTAMKIYGESYATGGFYTGGLFGDKSAPCLISPELAIVSAGTGMLTNGRAEINFDPLFAENIQADIPIRITVTPKGKPAGFIYITETKSSGFKVELEPIPGLEKNATDITFDWIAFGTLKENQTSPEAQAQWQKMMQERDAKRAEAKTRNQERNRMLEQHK